MMDGKVLIILSCMLLTQIHHLNGMFSPNVTVKSCNSRMVVILLDNAADGGLIYIQGRSSSCRRSTSSQQMNVEFDFDLCSIEYDSKFRVIVQRNAYYQTGHDKVIPVMCLVDTSDLKVSSQIYPEEVLAESMNITTRPIVRMRMLTESEDVTGGEITLDDNVKMSLTLEDQYKGDFDIKAKECTASLISLVREECSTDEDLFPNFEHMSAGDISSTFRAFQPTNLQGDPEVDVSFSCTVEVCMGDCQKAICGEIIGWGRKKRDTNDDDVIDSITCGTTLKVKTPVVDAQKCTFCNHLEEEEKADSFAIIVSQMYCYYKCPVALPHDAAVWSAVCDCAVESEYCMDKYIASSVIAITTITLLFSWVVCGCVMSKLKQLGKSSPPDDVYTGRRLSDRGISMARAVGRRLSSMLQIPVGYDLKGPKMETIPDMEPTPPQKRRESVTVTRVDFLDQ